MIRITRDPQVADFALGLLTGATVVIALAVFLRWGPL